MITKYKFGPLHDRAEALRHIVENKLKVIDVGGATSFADGYLDAIIDIGKPAAQAKNIFLGNINDTEVWGDVREHVFMHGLWDFAICTHTLEDISNPALVCKYMQRFAKAGYIALPSKYEEFGRFGVGKTPRGYIHHRWVFDMENGGLIAYPKLNLIEDDRFDLICNHPKAADRKELSLWWEGEIGMKIVNDDFLGPTEEAVNRYYDHLLIMEP